jgi:hypothetical protein
MPAWALEDVRPGDEGEGEAGEGLEEEPASNGGSEAEGRLRQRGSLEQGRTARGAKQVGMAGGSGSAQGLRTSGLWLPNVANQIGGK